MAGKPTLFDGFSKFYEKFSLPHIRPVIGLVKARFPPRIHHLHKAKGVVIALGDFFSQRFLGGLFH